METCFNSPKGFHVGNQTNVESPHWRYEFVFTLKNGARYSIDVGVPDNPTNQTKENRDKEAVEILNCITKSMYCAAQKATTS